MGRSVTPRYVIRDERGQHYGQWHTRSEYGRKAYGQPTTQNLMKWRDGFNRSLCKGGANEHLGAAAWIQHRIYIYDQYLGRKVVEYNPPAFELLPDNLPAQRAA